ncbi:MAG: TetR family transcriptional regulator [Alphaproteobacteria bacterium]|nr:TetR family transcriptional regulator [Alphaproteobacteria bacterium]
MSRPTDPRLTDAILDSALRLLAARGYEATTVGAVARSARTSKAALYRRWPDKPALIADAVRHALRRANPALPETDDPRDDLRQVLRRVAHALTHTPYGGAVRAALGAMGPHPELAAALGEVERERRQVLRGPLSRLGVPAAAVDTESDRLLGALYLRALIRQMPLDDAFIDALCAPLGATLYVFAGLPGVGKSTLAAHLTRVRGALYLRVDTIEQAIRDAAGGLEGPEGYAVACAVARENLRAGRSVVADMVNPLPVTRQAWRAVAAGGPCHEIEVVCSDRAEHRRRVETRPSTVPGLRLPDWAEVEARQYAPWEGDRVVIDTAGRTVAESCAEVEARTQAHRQEHAGPSIADDAARKG